MSLWGAYLFGAVGLALLLLMLVGPDLYRWLRDLRMQEARHFPDAEALHGYAPKTFPPKVVALSEWRTR